MRIYIEIYSIEMNKSYIEGWFVYDEGMNLLEILRDLGLEISARETSASVIETGNKKTAFVKDMNGFKFVCSFRSAT